MSFCNRTDCLATGAHTHGVVVPALGVRDCQEMPVLAHAQLVVSAQAEIERLTGELARERAMRASTGCVCLAVTRDDVLIGHAAGCPAMESGRLRAERDHYQAQARTFFDFGARKGAEANHWHAVALAMREAARCESTVYTTAMLAVIEAAFREPGDAPKGGTDVR